MIGELRSLAGEDPETLCRLLRGGPLVRIFPESDGKPREASGLLRVAAPAERVWHTVRDLERLPSFIAMVESLRRLPPGPRGEELLQVNLKFKIAIFSARFDFVVRVMRDEGHKLELTYHSGKVPGLIIRFELLPLSQDETVLLCFVRFDPRSLGWLANIFIRYHPEIEWGVHAGSAMSIATAVARATTGDRLSLG